MESLKAIVGLSKKEPDGQEPISGREGAGNVAEPFDQGNNEVQDRIPATNQATQHINPAADLKPENSVHSEPYAGNNPPASTDSKAAIGSPGWFKSAVPTGQHNSELEQQPHGANAGHEQVNGFTQPQESDLAPNQLGGAVPAGPAVEKDTTPRIEEPPASIQSPPAAGTEAMATQNGVGNHPASQNTVPRVNVPDGQGSLLSPQSATGTPSSPSNTTGGALFGNANPFGSSTNGASNNAAASASDIKARKGMLGENPNAIPFAGGQRVGSVAAIERERMRSVSHSQDLDTVRETPLPVYADATTRANTAQNAGPPPSMGADATGASTTSNAAPSGISAAGETGDAPAAAAVSTSAGTPGGESASMATGHSRKTSRSLVDRIKDRLSPGAHKDK